ncbi:hypothetical protein P5V15_014106 [Pogonomyrmex californicus]
MESKETLRVGINALEDVGNNIPLKESIKTRFKELSRNLKRKAEEKIKDLMKGSGYKNVPQKRRRFSFLLSAAIASQRGHHLVSNTVIQSKKSTKSNVRRKDVKKIEEEKENYRQKNYKIIRYETLSSRY